MKKLIFLLCLTANFAFSQNPGFSLLKKINGVDVFYKATKTKEEAKKDTWIIEFEYINTTGKDIYYKSLLTKDDGLLGTGQDVVIGYFALASIKNAKALSFSTTEYADIAGDKTRIMTDKKEPIFVIKKGKIYTRTMDYRNDKGVEPIMSIEIQNEITFIESLSELL